MGYIAKPGIMRIDPTITNLPPDQFSNEEPIQSYPFGPSTMRITNLGAGFPEETGDVITSRTDENTGHQIFVGTKTYFRTFGIGIWNSWRELGSVSGVTSVNGKTGDVVLTAEDVDAETPDGAQTKANQAEQNAKDYTDQEVSKVQDDLAAHKAQDASQNNVHGLRGNKIALGEDSSASEGYAVAVGPLAEAGEASVALGTGSSASQAHSVALGPLAMAINTGEGVLGHPFSTTDWKVPGSFTVQGTKNFEIPHPKPEKSATHRIRHAAVEAPTAGDTLYRYTVTAAQDNDMQTIDLPDYFIYLNKDVQIFVTPQGHFGNGYGELNKEMEQLEIHCQSKGEYNVLVIGTRNDDHPSVQNWDIKGVEREIGESWTGETYAFSVDEIIEIEEIKEVSA